LLIKRWARAQRFFVCGSQRSTGVATIVLPKSRVKVSSVKDRQTREPSSEDISAADPEMGALAAQARHSVDTTNKAVLQSRFLIQRTQEYLLYQKKTRSRL
jgi:hypothetical protein